MTAVAAKSPTMWGHTRSRLCPRDRWPSMAPESWLSVMMFMDRTDGFMIVETASLYR